MSTNSEQNNTQQEKRRIYRWLAGALALAIAFAIVAGIYMYVNGTIILAQGNVNNEAGAEGQATETREETGAETGAAIRIQPATEVMGEVSAAGNLALVNERYVSSNVDGVVYSVAVEIGDTVSAGDLLFSIDRTETERAVRRAELEVELKKNALVDLTTDPTLAEIAVAEAAVTEAREQLADIKLGASEEELSAARSTLTAAQATLNELLAGPSQDELTQLSADLRQAEVTLAESQRAYDQIKWRNDQGMTSEAADLQSATIDYEKTLAAYNESVASAAQSDIATAKSSVLDAQHALNDLENSPTPAEIASAEATLIDAQATLTELLAGSTDTELRDAEIALEQALIDLEEATANLAATQITAPIDGTVLAIEADLGERITQGASIMALADINSLELTIDVAEVDIVHIEQGQDATVEIDALLGQYFEGTVDYIAPSSSSSDGIITYPVTIQLADTDGEQLLPGMTGVATLTDADTATSGGWLVPTTAIQEHNGASIVLVQRGEEATLVPVDLGTMQGEWTVVYSSQLQAGDEVIGTLTSYIDDSDDGFGGPDGPNFDDDNDGPFG